MIKIRRLQSGETDLFRQVRLMALQDAPYAFSSTYESAIRRSSESWHEQADSTVSGSNRATFIALSNDVPVGIAALYRLDHQADVGEVVQVWVSPTHRGTNLAWDLMNVVFKWASENDFRAIKAVVTKGNSRALRFYTKYGFSVDQFSNSDSSGVCLVKEVR